MKKIVNIVIIFALIISSFVSVNADERFQLEGINEKTCIFAAKGDRVKLEVSVYDSKYNKMNAYDTRFKYKWYKVVDSGGSLGEVISTKPYVVIDSVQEDDFDDEDGEWGDGRERDTHYYCLLYVDGKERSDDSILFYIYERATVKTKNIKIGKTDILKDGQVAHNLPDGVSYVDNTKTVYLNNYTDNAGGIVADGNVSLYVDGNDKLAGGIDCEGSLAICGSGELTLSDGILAERNIEISNVDINIKGNTHSKAFYGIELMPWCNYADGNSSCEIIIKSSNINISNTVNPGNNIFNVGIDAQDADLTIKESKIKLNMVNGITWGFLTGLINSYDEQYGGTFDVDDKSNLVFQATNSDYPNDHIYAVYCYKDKINSKYIYTGLRPKGVLKTKKEAFVKNKVGDSVERIECTGAFMELTPIKRASDYSSIIETNKTVKVKKTAIKKVKAKKKTLKVIWKKVSGINGYQLQYSLKRKFKKAKTLTIKKQAKHSTTIKKLKRKGKYYIRIRTYIVVNKKTYYSAWSKVKKKRTK